MTERQKQAEFLKSLIRFGDTQIYGDFPNRLEKAQQAEWTLRRKISSLILLGSLALAGFAYTAVFLPEAFQSSSWIVKFFSVVGLAAVICLILFMAYWMWYRKIVNGLAAEGRSLVHRILQAKLEFPGTHRSSGTESTAAPVTTPAQTADPKVKAA